MPLIISMCDIRAKLNRGLQVENNIISQTEHKVFTFEEKPTIYNQEIQKQVKHTVTKAIEHGIYIFRESCKIISYDLASLSQIFGSRFQVLHRIGTYLLIVGNPWHLEMTTVLISFIGI